VTGLVVEAGIYFLLLFSPFAFGGVEGWALGVIQGVAGLVFVAWAWGRIQGATPGRDDRPGLRDGSARRLHVLWGAIALFVALVIFQVVPLSPAWIARLSPATHSLYARTLPGYGEGKDSDLAELPSWLVKTKADEIPLDPKGVEEAEARFLHPPVSGSGFDSIASSWRTLSIFPAFTRERIAWFLALVGIFAAVTGHFTTRARIHRLLGVAVFAGFSVSLLGILQKFNWNGKLFWIREGNYSDPFGPFVDRNTYAAFAGTVLPIAICAIFGARAGLARGNRDSLSLLLFNGFAAMTMAGGIFYSLSRGGMISTTLSILVIAILLLYYGRQRAELATLAGILLVSASFLLWIGPDKVLERVGTLSQAQSTPSLALRIEAWRRSLHLVADHPIFGAGLGTFPFAFMSYSPPGRSWWNIAHNEYVELACDTGLAGVAIVALGFVAWISIVARPSVFKGHSPRYAFAGIVSGIVALLFHSAVTSNLQVPANSLLLVVMGGVLVCLVFDQEARNRADRGAIHGSPRGRRAGP